MGASPGTKPGPRGRKHERHEIGYDAACPG